MKITKAINEIPARKIKSNLPQVSIAKEVVNKYLSYCSAQEKEKIVWYLKAIIIIPCVIMIPSISAVYSMTGSHELYVGFCTSIFFLNIMVHIAQAKAKIFVPLYQASIALMIIFPIVTYFITNQ